MFYNIGFTYTTVFYYHSTVITKVIELYYTEWQYYRGMAVNYHSKMFYNIGPCTIITTVIYGLRNKLEGLSLASLSSLV